MRYVSSYTVEKLLIIYLFIKCINMQLFYIIIFYQFIYKINYAILIVFSKDIITIFINYND